MVVRVTFHKNKLDDVILWDNPHQIFLTDLRREMRRGRERERDGSRESNRETETDR